MHDLIDRSKLPRIRVTCPRGDRLLEEVIGVLNDAIQKAPTVDAVPREEHELLLKRFRHLLESDFIRSFDEYDPKTGTYKRDISEADRVAHVVRCGRCGHSIVIRSDDAARLYCTAMNDFVCVEFSCSEGFLHGSEVKIDHK